MYTLKFNLNSNSESSHAIIREMMKAAKVIAEKYKENLPGLIQFEPIQDSSLSLVDLQASVCRIADISWENLTGPRGKLEICNARFVYIYLRRRLFGHSYMSIGKSIGRDHTSVINAMNVARQRVEMFDPVFAAC